jgi:glucan biosynthesis protein C
MRAATREHDWDALRALLMLLGIPFHAAMPYRPGQEWIVTAPVGSILLTWASDLIHLFRMPAFFIVAGYFAALLLARRAPGAWLKGRLVRLCVPLATGLVLVVPILNVACERFALPWGPAWDSFERNSATSGGYWVRHLWFLIVLIYLSAASAGAAALWPRLREWSMPARADAAIARRLPLALVALGLAIGGWTVASRAGFDAAGLATNLPQDILRLNELLFYAPWFAAGLVLQRMPATRAAFGRPSRGSAMLAAGLAVGAL